MKYFDHQDLSRTPSHLKSLGAGKTLAVTHASELVAFVIPAHPCNEKRPFGLAQGKFTVPSDFNQPLTDIEEAIYKA
jgi:antitoxin (DNA-binding transcriptional repressor) of toxin-antitoxin stability system